MKKNVKICLVLSLIFIVASCSITRRVHLRGFHVEKIPRRSAHKPPLAQKYFQETLLPAALPALPSSFVAVASNNTILNSANPGTPSFLYRHELKNTLLKSSPGEECDIIIFKNGEEVRAKVLEIGREIVRYKKCNNPDGPVFSIYKTEIFMIKYPNGSNSLFSEEKQPLPEKKKTSGSGRSQLIALFLAIFLGAFGVHRFYLGYTGMGLLYLFTAGLCGIGALVDIILIATGNLRPYDGDYDETL